MSKYKFLYFFILALNFLSACSLDKNSDIKKKWSIEVRKDNFDDKKQAFCIAKNNSIPETFAIEWNKENDSYAVYISPPKIFLDRLEKIIDEKVRDCLQRGPQLSEWSCEKMYRHGTQEVELSLRVDKKQIFEKMQRENIIFLDVNNSGPLISDMAQGKLLHIRSIPHIGFSTRDNKATNSSYTIDATQAREESTPFDHTIDISDFGEAMKYAKSGCESIVK